MMRLSEAIRLGSMLHPQGFGENKTWVGDQVVATCALGAAEEAGWKDEELVGPNNVPCPYPTCGTMYCVESGVAHLNDAHLWTRERIADWVESFEPAQPESEPEEAPCLVTSGR